MRENFAQNNVKRVNGLASFLRFSIAQNCYERERDCTVEADSESIYGASYYSNTEDRMVSKERERNINSPTMTCIVQTHHEVTCHAS